MSGETKESGNKPEGSRLLQRMKRQVGVAASSIRRKVQLRSGAVRRMTGSRWIKPAMAVRSTHWKNFGAAVVEKRSRPQTTLRLIKGNVKQTGWQNMELVLPSGGGDSGSTSSADAFGSGILSQGTVIPPFPDFGSSDSGPSIFSSPKPEPRPAPRAPRVITPEMRRGNRVVEMGNPHAMPTGDAADDSIPADDLPDTSEYNAEPLIPSRQGPVEEYVVRRRPQNAPPVPPTPPAQEKPATPPAPPSQTIQRKSEPGPKLSQEPIHPVKPPAEPPAPKEELVTPRRSAPPAQTIQRKLEPAVEPPAQVEAPKAQKPAVQMAAPEPQKPIPQEPVQPLPVILPLKRGASTLPAEPALPLRVKRAATPELPGKAELATEEKAQPLPQPVVKPKPAAQTEEQTAPPRALKSAPAAQEPSLPVVEKAPEPKAEPKPVILPRKLAATPAPETVRPVAPKATAPAPAIMPRPVLKPVSRPAATVQRKPLQKITPAPASVQRKAVRRAVQAQPYGSAIKPTRALRAAQTPEAQRSAPEVLESFSQAEALPVLKPLPVQSEAFDLLATPIPQEPAAEQAVKVATIRAGLKQQAAARPPEKKAFLPVATPSFQKTAPRSKAPVQPSTTAPARKRVASSLPVAKMAPAARPVAHAAAMRSVIQRKALSTGSAAERPLIQRKPVEQPAPQVAAQPRKPSARPAGAFRTVVQRKPERITPLAKPVIQRTYGAFGALADAAGLSNWKRKMPKSFSRGSFSSFRKPSGLNLPFFGRHREQKPQEPAETPYSDGSAYETSPVEEQMPVVHARQEAETQTPAPVTPPPVESPAPVMEASSTEAMPATAPKEEKPEVKAPSPQELARQVYPLIKRMLAVEHERLSGRSF